MTKKNKPKRKFYPLGKPLEILYDFSLADLSENKKRILLLQKIAKARADCPKEIFSSALQIKSDNPEEKDAVPFTLASEVRKFIRDPFDRVGIMILPADREPQIINAGPVIHIACAFQLIDIQTGYAIVGYCTASGGNRDWSGNTSNTRAQKQFALWISGMNWLDPEVNSAREIRKAAKIFDVTQAAEVINNAKQTVAQEMGQFFGEYPDKLSDAKNSQKSSKNPKV